MKELPNPFWALMFMVIGCILLIAVLLKVTERTTQIEVGLLMAVATAGSNIISGAFGYIQGRKDGESSVSVPTDPKANVNVAVGPADPKA